MALMEFYGRECPHCVRMEPAIERLKKEAGLDMERFEVWHDETNAEKMEQVDKGRCGGVPYFHNTKTKAFLCGEVPYEELLAWAKAT